MGRRDGKVALMTGAAQERGQGACEARLFVAVGARVVLIDVLVNNAGVWHRGGVLDASPEDYRRVVEINQTGVFLGMHTVAPAMCRGRGGSIVNISSTAGLRGEPGILAYVASKW